ncbi:ABC transporter substrate-binding protein [Actinokineospora enzanensis]|uniref:ABC transporter substrate-binding protein n=1 Tax=Actinokineospora enzanensis TaxID=155975 RepID=UPI00035D6360|nr:ABC transporter substrate-binding protein [Actinokineospora enzanensis]
MGRLSRVALVLLAAAGTVTGCANPANEDDRLDSRGPITFVDSLDLTEGKQVEQLVERWNNGRGFKEPVTFIEQSRESDALRASLMATSQDVALAGEQTRCNDVMMLDTVWTSEFARAGYLQPLNGKDFGIDRFLSTPVRNATLNGTLYAIPARSDAGLLFYRKDILDAEHLTPPRTWAELRQISQQLMPKYHMDGYVGQLYRYEGLTVNALEAIWYTGGDLVSANGEQVTADSAEAKRGVALLSDGLRDGWIPRAATGFTEEDSRRYFQEGKALFMRNWPYTWPRLAAPDSPVAGRFGVTSLPGPSALGGWNIAISPCSRHQQTARDFIRFYTEETQQRVLFSRGGYAPSLRSLYSDPVLRGQYPYLEVLGQSIEHARDRGRIPDYDRITGVVQEDLYSALDRAERVEPAMDRLAEEIRATLHGNH